MNKELELEVEKYIEKVWGGYKDDVFKHDDIITDQTLSEITKKDFIEGATSKYVEKQKLEFAIEQLKKASMLIVSQHERKAKLRIIIELEQKLSEL